jgi:hypothetical protein
MSKRPFRVPLAETPTHKGKIVLLSLGMSNTTME